MELRGITVILIDKTEIGRDPFNHPIYQEREITVPNVLVAPMSAEAVINTQSLTGKRAAYTLGIPKGDANTWEDREVIFFGQRWKTFGACLEGIEEMIPLSWNKKVMVECYE